MSELHFLVRGSSGEPYAVTADGSGPDLRITCSCPGGRLGQRMCKHVAALLVGDVSALVSECEPVTELARRAEGSDLPAQAAAHAPGQQGARRGDPSFPDTGVFADDVAPAAKALERMGWAVEVASYALLCRGLTPTGRRAKAVGAGIVFDPVATPRAPYRVWVSGPQGTTRDVKHLAYAVEVLLKTIEPVKGIRP